MGRVFGIISLILSIAGLICSPFPFLMFALYDTIFWFLTLIFAVPGLIFGIIGIKKDDKAGLGIAGLIISSIALVLWVIFAILGDIRLRVWKETFLY